MSVYVSLRDKVDVASYGGIQWLYSDEIKTI